MACDWRRTTLKVSLGREACTGKWWQFCVIPQNWVVFCWNFVVVVAVFKVALKTSFEKFKQCLDLCKYGRISVCLFRPLPRERKIPGSNPACVGIFSGSSHTSDLKIGTPVATLPGAWHYRVSSGTGQPGVSILWLGEVESWICNFYLSVAARKLVWADPSLRYTCMLLGR